MFGGHHSPTPQTGRLNPQWIAVSVLSGIAFTLGTVGFWLALHHPEGSHVPANLFDCLYKSFQLFIFHSGGEIHSPPLPLEIARFLAPFSLCYAGILGFLSLLRDQLQSLRLPFINEHVVVFGLNSKSLSFIEDLRSRQTQVVVIEKDPHHPLLAKVRSLGVHVIIGDPSDEAILKAANVGKASHFIAFSESDQENLSSATTLLQRVLPSGTSLKCFVHTQDPGLRPLIQSHPIFQAAFSAPNSQAQQFSLTEILARQALSQFPLEFDNSGKSAEQVHLIIVGFGKLGEVLAEAAAAIAHYQNDTPFRITVVDQKAVKRQLEFRQMYPQFLNICPMEFVESEISPGQFCQKVSDWKKANETTTFLFTISDEAVSLSTSLALAKFLDEKTFRSIIYLNENSGFAALFGKNRKILSPHQIFTFGPSVEICSGEAILQGKLDYLSRIIHENYRQKRFSEGDTEASNSSTVSWAGLPEHLRLSNRRQADHIFVKLRSLGWKLQKAEKPDSAQLILKPEDVETLSRMEHCRWNADRFLSGWRKGEMDKPNKISPYLVSWIELPENIKEYDREAVRLIPQLLRQAGLEPVSN